LLLCPAHKSVKMAKACHLLVALAATFSLAMGQTMSGPGQEAGTNYFWPRYNYTNADLKYTSELLLDTSYVCKWGVTIPGMNMAQDILVLPPCTYITPHWHPDTYELNFILEGNLTYWIFPYGKPAEPTPPLHGNVPQGSALVSPLGVMHLLYNDECDKLAMMHSFPTSTNEDFFSAWGNQKEMPETYLNNVLPQSPGAGARLRGSANMIKKNLNIPDNVHTLSKQCMQRCGLSQQYYDNLKCPTEPLEQKVIKPLASSPLV